MVKKYKYLIFDADHTLIDFELDEKAAFLRLFEENGVKANEEMLRVCREISVKTWNEVGLSDVHTERTQREFHNLYRSHLTLLFRRIFERYPLDMFPQDAGARFLVLLETGGAEIEGARETVEYLAKKYRLAVATNGLHAIQTGRLKEFERYFYKVYISEDLGVIKPLEGFFERIVSDLGAKKEECLMIGDSPESDIAGATRAGIDSCWLNRFSRPRGEYAPTYEIVRLSDLTELL